MGDYHLDEFLRQLPCVWTRGGCFCVIALENLFNFGFASIPSDDPQELDPFGMTAIRWNTDARSARHAPEGVEIGLLENPPAPFVAGGIAVAVKG